MYRLLRTPPAAFAPPARILADAMSEGRQDVTVSLQVRGGCMAPLIRDGDRVIVTPLRSRLATGALVLARSASGELICHRLLAASDGGFLLAGDRSGAAEEVPAIAVLGRVRQVIRHDRRLCLDGRCSRALDRAVAATRRLSLRLLASERRDVRVLCRGVRYFVLLLLVPRVLLWCMSQPAQ